MKKIYTLTIILLTSIATFAQAPNWLWAKKADGLLGSFPDLSQEITVDGNGNSYITGYFSSSTITFGGTTLFNNNGDGSADIFIVKYDASGNVLWAQSIGGNSYDRGLSITVDTNGNLYLTGHFSSPTINFGSTTLTNADNSGNSFDVFVAKYDSSGNVLWATSAGGASSDEGYSISIDPNGNLYLTGYFESTSITFSSITLTKASVSIADIFIVKYNTAGNALWAQRAGGGNFYNYDNDVSITADINGNPYLTGHYNSPTITFGTNTLTNADNTGNTANIFIVKYDASGNVLWARDVGGALVDRSNSISIDSNGNSYITGNFRSTAITFGATTLTNTDATGTTSDIFLAKYNTSGNMLWVQQVGGIAIDDGISIKVNSKGNLYLTGCFYSDAVVFGTATLTNTNSTGNFSNVLVAKYDTLGNVIWAKSAGGIYSSWGTSITTDANENSYITGAFESSISFENTNLTNSGIFVARLDGVTDIEERNTTYTINIFPNPSNGQINIISTKEINELKITNLLGQIIYQTKSKETNISVEINNEGIYFITLISDKQTITKKVFVTQ